MNDPQCNSGDFDFAAARAGAFWVYADLEALLASVKPYDGPAAFAIDDLTDDEWNSFVAAVDE